MNSINKYSRHRARKLALQALYQWQMAATDLIELNDQYIVEMNPKKVDIDYFRILVDGITQSASALDQTLSGYLDREFEQVGPIELTILRIGIYELKNRLEVPYRVVMNEAIELCKTYGPEQSHKYINGILDKITKETRQLEIQDGHHWIWHHRALF